jgi:hypothetical protein
MLYLLAYYLVQDGSWYDKNEQRDEGFEVLIAVVMKSSSFWDIMPCSLLKVK